MLETETQTQAQTYKDSAGQIMTAAQVASEFRKARIVAGQPIEGTEYDSALSNWYNTYELVTEKEKRSDRASIRTLMVGIFISVFLAAIVGVSGGGILAFAAIFIIGTFLSMGLAAIVMIFTLPGKPPDPLV